MKSLFVSLVIATFIGTSVALPASANSQDIMIQGGPTSALDVSPVKVDSRIYIPEATPAPAVVLAHGFGGSKESANDQALKLMEAGYVVLTFSARGFGKTVAPISMNSPQYEVADARALIDYLATRSEVLQDADNDPVVGFAGGSYGGALSLLVAGYDQRVDAVASDITWNNLKTALFPQTSDTNSPGVFKKMWTSYFFSVGMATPPNLVNTCGRFSLEWCLLYQQAVTTGKLDSTATALINQSSPSSITSRITAPTLLMGGLADSLFPLSELDANYQQIKSAQPSTPLRVVWHAGGHDGGVNESDRLENLILSWFNTHLKGEADNTKANFIATLSAGNVVGRNSSSLKFFEGAQYTGLFGEAQTVVQVAGKSQRIVAPAGGEPALMTVLPGLGGSLASLVGRGLPNQSAVFSSEPFATSTPLLGSSTVKLRVTSEIDREEAVFFASLRIQSGVDAQRFPNGLVSPIRVENLQAGVPVEFTITLPTIVAEVNAGEQLQLVISSTDAAYTLPQTPGVYSIELVDGRVAVPQTALTLINNERSPITWLLLAAAVIVGLALLVWLRRPRMKTAEFKPEYADVPLRVENLVKEFKGGHRAVDDISWDVPAGVVLGLLGPNGAGKTTTMRMAMGLINPTSGSVYVFGHEVQPGSPALSRIGALVEGAGFLPHLTGRENLMLFWQASGRTTEDPQLDAVLAIADLGTAADKRVRAYSQGMRQRLGIAQAMLGMPDLLMLDEPTNGLDPPQIRAMRTMMQEYAATGRTVIVSSHLLSEVEQTCSHVIVMHRGRLVTRGRVDELMAGKGNMRLEDFFIEVVGDDLTVGK